MNQTAQRQTMLPEIKKYLHGSRIRIPCLPQIKIKLSLKAGILLFAVFQTYNLALTAVMISCGLGAAIYLAAVIYGISFLVIYGLRRHFVAVTQTATFQPMTLDDHKAFPLTNLGYVFTPDSETLCIRVIGIRTFFTNLALVRIRSNMIPNGIMYELHEYKHYGVIETITIKPRDNDPLARRWHAKLRNNLRVTEEVVSTELYYTCGTRREICQLGKYKSI